MLLPLFALAACKRDATCEATVDGDVGTVIDVTAAGLQRVEFGTTEALGTVAPAGAPADDADEALLLGLPPLTDVHWSALLDGGGRCEGVTRTGGLPSGLPDVTIREDVADRQAPQQWWLASVMGEAPAFLVFDRSGRRVWAHEQDPEELTVEITFSADGGSLIYNEFGLDRTVDIGRLARMAWTGEELESIPTERGHHAFAELPDGTLAWLMVDARQWFDEDTGETVTVAGDAVVELSPGGEPRVLWSTWDDLTPRKHVRWDDGFYPGMHDWTHGNGLRWDEPSDTWIVSLGNVDTVVQVSRADGRALRIFGQDGMRVAGGIPFAFQHDAHLTESGTLLLFGARPDHLAAGAAEYVIDDEAGELRMIWAYGFDDLIFSHSLGQATRFANGNTLVNFGGAGLLREVTPEGEVVWEAHTDSGSWFAQVHPFDDFYAPLETSP